MRTSAWYIPRRLGAPEGEQKQLQAGGDPKADDAQENEGRLHRTKPERAEDENEYCWKKYLTGFVCGEEEERGKKSLNDSQSSGWVPTSPLRKSPVKCPICHTEGEWCHCLLSGKKSRWSPEQRGFHLGRKPYEDSGSEQPAIVCSAFQVPEPAHAEEKLYECGECGKKVKGHWRLKQHQKKHAEEKGHECGRSFRKGSHFVEHQQIHSGEKPYQCKECGKTFTQSSHLAVHRQIHSGGKTYACKECGKCFRLLVDFTIHQLSH